LGIAGYSGGSIATLRSAGALRRSDEPGTYYTQMNPEDEGFTRAYAEGPGQDDDHGPFVEADAYMLISGEFAPNDLTTDELTLIDPARPNMTGKDLIEKPVLQISSQYDLGVQPGGSLFNAVTGAVGVNEAPFYGVGVAGANHLTSMVASHVEDADLLVTSWSPWFQYLSMLLPELAT
jgi:hypothetical protein